MPKASAAQVSAKKEAAANALKRNQACHQCRKKKLKCDAQSPCSTCAKTHAFAVRMNPATAPAEPQCTYDSAAAMDSARLQELEAKIASLEGIITSQLPGVLNPQPVQTDSPGLELPTGLPSVSPPSATLWNSTPSSSYATSPPNSDRFGTMPYQSDPTLTMLSGLSSVSSPTMQQPHTPLLSGPASGSHADLLMDFNSMTHNSDSTAPNQPYSFTPPPLFQIIDPSWPEKIPPPELLHHLVETFFACVPHAHRVIHRPTFMNSLLEHPSSFNFPHPVVLHAICAISSLYTPVVTDGSERNMWHVGPDMLFNSAVAPKLRGEWDPTCPPDPSIYVPMDDRTTKIEESGFGMKHAEWCMDGWLEPARTGQKIMQLLQSQLIITWYFYSVGRAVDIQLFVSIGSICRLVIPIGLNAVDPWGPLSRQPYKALVMGPLNPTPEQEETYRNIFWLWVPLPPSSHYSKMSRMLFYMWQLDHIPTLYVRDDDVSQYLPIRSIDFPGQFIPLADRQRLNTPKAVVIHPPALTDSFTLYIKACVLLGKVKTFNYRFKTKFEDSVGGAPDPRETTQFQVLDSVLQKFKTSFPKELREPMSGDGKMDPTLHMALLLPHVATIVLHDPHADVNSPNCMSADRILAAARAILDSLYKLTATTFDLLLLDHACSFCWFVCATTLMRFLKAKILADDEAGVGKLSSEIQVVRFMLGNLGSRTICGLRQIMILEDLYANDILPLLSEGHASPAVISPVVTSRAPAKFAEYAKKVTTPEPKRSEGGFCPV
ncbi:hypothetical protein FRB97_007936 [Tulasnella sp. 331]|nr:hypothetical protein FRB97_007936 [Tulasnella sp. 331]